MIPFKIEEIGFDGGKTWSAVPAYAQSKSANVLFSVELAKRLKADGILSFSLHPGSMLLMQPNLSPFPSW